MILPVGFFSGRPLRYISRWARPGKLTNSAGAIKQIVGTSGSWQLLPAVGDLFYFYFILDGTETKMNFVSYGDTNGGIWRWKLNDFTEDTTDYDEYLAAGATISRYIDITGKTQPGRNVLRLRLYTKNAASTDYTLIVYQVCLE